MLLHEYPGVNAIKAGRMFLKPSTVYETITHCCRMVLLEDYDPKLPLGRSGSATLVRYANTNYVVMTRHELDIPCGVEPCANILETVRISSGSRQLANIPLKTCIFETSNPDQDYHDIIAFEVADNWNNKTADLPYFFPLSNFSHSKRIMSFLIGYPTHDEVMTDYIDAYCEGTTGEIHLLRAISDCEFDENFRTGVAHFKRYIHTRSGRIVDGYSGGAIFSLTGDLGIWEIVLDGIVVRANDKFIHIIDSDYIVKLITKNQ